MKVRFSRRGFLSASATVLAIGATRARSSAFDDLPARVAEVQLLPESYGTTRIWGYEGMAPGPEIRVAQGARVQKRLVNELAVPTSTHWHGIRIDNAMDGVAGLTQEAVAPGSSFEYDFTVPDAGTYWYHAHSQSLEQVARGLHGPLIVEEPDPLDIDAEEVLIFDDWRIDPETGQIADNFGAMHDLSHAGRIGNFVTTNGTYNLARPVQRNARLRLRLINAAGARIFRFAIEGLEGWIVAQDGMPLGQPIPLTEPFVLAPAQRLDLIVDVVAEVGEAGHIVHLERGESFSQVAFEVRGAGTTTRRVAPAPLPPNEHAMPDLPNARALELKMQGGAMGGMRDAMMNGKMTSMRDIAQSGNFWAFNGAVGGTGGDPLAVLSRGESVRLKIVNDTAFPHAMHLHGMHFHEVSAEGVPGAMRDTTLVERGQMREIAFVADNPGKWLLHCHMLSHAASGMMARIDVI